MTVSETVEKQGKKKGDICFYYAEVTGTEFVVPL